MSLLSATDLAIQARKIAHDLCGKMQALNTGNGNRHELVNDCKSLQVRVSQIVDELERSLVHEDETVAVTFFPFRQQGDTVTEPQIRESGSSYRIGNSPAEQSRGTMMLPSTPPEESA